MSTPEQDVERLVKKEYQHGFVTEIDAETLPPGLNEDVIRHISAKKEIHHEEIHLDLIIV